MLPQSCFSTIAAAFTPNQPYDCQATCNILLFLANLASFPKSFGALLRCKVFSTFATLAQLDHSVKGELAVLMYNCVTTFDETELEMMLEFIILPAF